MNRKQKLAIVVGALAVVGLGIASCGNDEGVPDLIRRLEQGERRAAKRAAVALAKLGPAEADAVPALTATLRRVMVEDEKDQGRLGGSCAEALGRIGEAARPAIPTLLAALQDPNSQLFVDVCMALGLLGPVAEAAVPDLVRLLDDPEYRNSREWLLLALAGIGTVRSTEAIVAMLDCTQPGTYSAIAHKAKTWLGGGAPYPHWDAFRLDGEVVAGALLRRMEEDRRRILSLLEWMDARSPREVRFRVQSLVAILNDPAPGPGLRAAAAAALGRMGDASVEGIRALAGLATHSLQRVQMAAVKALVDIGPAAAPVLVSALASEYVSVRQNAAQGLGMVATGEPEVVSALTSRLADPDSRVKVAAAEALGLLQPPPLSAVPALEEAQKDAQNAVRIAARSALKRIKGE